MPYWLYIDDERKCPWDRDSFFVAKSSSEAIEIVKKNGLPEFISFDHDLGGDDTSIVFILWMIENYPDSPIKTYKIHSANPVGSKNIESYMRSWAKAASF